MQCINLVADGWSEGKATCVLHCREYLAASSIAREEGVSEAALATCSSTDKWLKSFRALVLSVFAKIKTGTYTWRSAAQAHGYWEGHHEWSSVRGAGPSGSDGGHQEKASVASSPFSAGIQGRQMLLSTFVSRAAAAAAPPSPPHLIWILQRKISTST